MYIDCLHLIGIASLNRFMFVLCFGLNRFYSLSGFVFCFCFFFSFFFILVFLFVFCIFFFCFVLRLLSL